MDPLVFFAVIAAAAMHAGWNALLKVGLDRFATITLMHLVAGVIAAVVLPLVDWPSASAWPWLIASVGLHLGYNFFLIQAYRVGDLGQVYPIARGAAPLVVALATLLFVPGDDVGFAGYLGIVALAVGVFLMSARGGRDLKRLNTSAIGYALGTAAFIAGYTLADGVGARRGGSAHGYTAWLFVLNSLALLGIIVARRGVSGLAALRPRLAGGVIGGALSLAAYGIAIWAMTVAPIALVAALRETSVLFAASIAIMVLKEPMTYWRLAAAIVIVMGIVTVRLG